MNTPNLNNTGQRLMKWKLSFPIFVFACCVGFFWIDLPIKLRAVDPAVNYAVYALFCALLPASLFVWGWNISGKWHRALVLAVSVIIGIPSLLWGGLAFQGALEAYREGYDAAMVQVDEVTDGEFAYRLYRTNCGATCAYGLKLRRERPLPLGTKTVEPLWSVYRAEEGELTLSANAITVRYGRGKEAVLSRQRLR